MGLSNRANLFIMLLSVNILLGDVARWRTISRLVQSTWAIKLEKSVNSYRMPTTQTSELISIKITQYCVIQLWGWPTCSEPATSIAYFQDTFVASKSLKVLSLTAAGLKHMKWLLNWGGAIPWKYLWLILVWNTWNNYLKQINSASTIE